MGKALEVISGRVTAPSSTLTAVTMATGNSLTIRNTPFDADIRMLKLWSLNQTAGTLRVRSPKMHDNVQGIRAKITASNATPVIPPATFQRLYAQDTLVVELSGSATAGDIEQMGALLFYGSLPGTDARFISPEELFKRAVNLVTVENSITGGTSGGYSGEVALNATFDLLKANTDYALLGYLIDVKAAVVRWRGADSGNLGIGGPGDPTIRDLTRDWFLDLSRDFVLPLIPVFNSANKSGILVDVACDENGGTFVVNSIFAELGASGAAAPAR